MEPALADLSSPLGAGDQLRRAGRLRSVSSGEAAAYGPTGIKNRSMGSRIGGLGLAAFRRYVQRPDWLNIKRDDAWILGTLAFIALTGLSLEVMRLRGQQPAWAAWSWLGNTIARWLGPPPDSLPASYPYLWWAHQMATFVLIATLPCTNLLHIVSSPATILFQRLDPPGAIPKIDKR